MKKSKNSKASKRIRNNNRKPITPKTKQKKYINIDIKEIFNDVFINDSENQIWVNKITKTFMDIVFLKTKKIVCVEDVIKFSYLYLTSCFGEKALELGNTVVEKVSLSFLEGMTKNDWEYLELVKLNIYKNNGYDEFEMGCYLFAEHMIDNIEFRNIKN
jgi:hypothetical protein